MKWKMIRKGNKWKKRLSLDVDDWVTLIIVLLALNYIMLRLIFSKI